MKTETNINEIGEMGNISKCRCRPKAEPSKKFGPFLDLCVSSLRRGHANLLCIVPILSDVSEETTNHVVSFLFKQRYLSFTLGMWDEIGTSTPRPPSILPKYHITSTASRESLDLFLKILRLDDISTRTLRSVQL